MQTNPLIPTDPRRIARTTDDPLGDYPPRFKSYLETQGYKPITIADYSRCVGVLGELMQKHRIALGDLSEAQSAQLIAQETWLTGLDPHAVYRVKRFVQFLREQGIGKSEPAPVSQQNGRATLRQDYETYLRHQRGLSERTIHSNWRAAEQFLEFRFGSNTEKLAKLTGLDIARFLQQLNAQYKPHRVKMLSSRLRTFFRYLFRTGQTHANLALGIPSVAQRYGARLPRYITPEQVEALVAAVPSNRPTGRRNYAMVLLLARLGLRATEVIALRIDDIDWRAGEMIIRGKGQRHDRLPLPPDVGQALTNYIQLDRVTTCRALFVTAWAPRVPLKHAQVLNTVLKGAFARAGFKPPVPYVGTHILRHSLATHLVRRGASLDEVADLLRHHSRGTTMIYAKLDVEGLRSIAQPWPVDGGAQ